MVEACGEVIFVVLGFLLLLPFELFELLLLLGFLLFPDLLLPEILFFLALLQSFLQFSIVVVFLPWGSALLHVRVIRLRLVVISSFPQLLLLLSAGPCHRLLIVLCVVLLLVWIILVFIVISEIPLGSLLIPQV